jgi:PleD family two-component response regulator
MRSRLQANADADNLQHASQPAIAFSLGVIRAHPDSAISMEELLSQADRAMYEHKQHRRRTA